MILVAGGTGTLGTRLVTRLLARDIQVRILSREPSRLGADVGPKVEVVRGDVRDRVSVEAAAQGVQAVVSAVHGFAGRDVSPASVDRDGNANLIDAAVNGGAAFILVSVVGAAPDSPSELFRMKHAAEAHLRRREIPWTILRSTAYFETWLGLLEQTARRSGRPLVFGRGDNPVNFVSANDVATLLEHLLIEPGTQGRVLEIGGPENLTLNQLAAAVQRAAAGQQTPRHVPRPLLRAIALLSRPLRPDLARKARTALLMDTADMTFDAGPIHEAFPGLPSTTLAELLSSPRSAGRRLAIGRGAVQ